LQRSGYLETPLSPKCSSISWRSNFAFSVLYGCSLDGAGKYCSILKVSSSSKSPPTGQHLSHLAENEFFTEVLQLLDVAQGLRYLHYNDLVHADLKGVHIFLSDRKPLLKALQLNILMTDENRACLADFGLSHLVSESITGFTVSEPTSKGTVRWMAPELLVPDEKSQKTCSPTKKSDIYAFGMVIYEVGFPMLGRIIHLHSHRMLGYDWIEPFLLVIKQLYDRHKNCQWL
jgi:serine/threonine protein kinase